MSICKWFKSIIGRGHRHHSHCIPLPRHRIKWIGEKHFHFDPRLHSYSALHVTCEHNKPLTLHSLHWTILPHSVYLITSLRFTHWITPLSFCSLNYSFPIPFIEPLSPHSLHWTTLSPFPSLNHSLHISFNEPLPLHSPHWTTLSPFSSLNHSLPILFIEPLSPHSLHWTTPSPFSSMNHSLPILFIEPLPPHSLHWKTI